MNRWTTVALTVLLTMGLAARAVAHDPVAEAEYRLEEKLKSPWLTSNGFEIDFNRALGVAGRTGKPVFAYFTLSYMDVEACEELERGVLSTPEFKKFGESVVPFTHVNSGLGGDYANLLREKGGTEVPTFLVLDDQGNVAAKVTEGNDVASFEKAVQAAATFIAFRSKADKTLDEKVYVLTHDMDLGNLKPLLAKERAARLGDLNDAQQERFDAALLRLEIWTVASNLSGSSKRARDAGKLFAEMWAAGREPTTDEHARSFFTLMLDHAEATKDATLFKRALDKLAERFGEKPDSKEFLEQQAVRLKSLAADRDEAVEKRDGDAAK